MDFGTRFAILTKDVSQAAGVVTVTITTNESVHCWLKWTAYPIRLHLQELMTRGVFWLKDPYYCFVVWNDIEQNEPGDTLTHTFTWPDWTVCITRRYLFYGEEAGNLSPSTWGIYSYHYVPEPVEAYFYSDPGSGLVTVDGMVARTIANQTWATTHDGAGTYANPAGPAMGFSIMCGYYPNTWSHIQRAIMTFDTSSIPPGATILTARITAYGSDKLNQLGGNPGLNIFDSTPANNNNLVFADYQEFGITPLSTTIFYADLAEPGWNHWELAPAFYDRIITGGITRLAMREVTFDVANTPPPYVKLKRMHMTVFTADEGNRKYPYLKVTYLAQ
ncbi:hypothetical protein ES705_29751 [subsurface metagenome]